MKTDNCILSTMYQYICKSSNANSWSTMVKVMLCMYGFHDVWMYPLSVDEKVFIPLFKQRVRDCYLQMWDSDVKVAKPLLTCNCIKLDHQYECYLNKVINIKHKRALTKLRLSSTGLSIETGWHGSNRIDRNRRTCQLCNSVDIEDDYHFVLICPCYKDLRIMYIPLYYSKNPSMFKLVQLMQHISMKILNNLSAYVYEAFKKGQSY
jgi:hypothetical protein